MFSHRKVAESSGFFCSVIFLGWWLSFEPNFEAQLALEVPQRAFRPSFRTPHTQEIDGLTLPGRPSTLIGCRPRIDAVLSPVFWKMTSEARIRREKQKFGRSACKRSVYSLGKAAILAFFLDRGLVVQRVSFVWRAASAGGLRDDTAAGNVASLTFTRKCLLHASDCGCGNGFLFSQRPRPVSLWKEVPLTLIARRWQCAFLLSDSKAMLDVKDTVLRRELASIALATRKTKNFCRGMLSAFRAGVSVVVGFHKPCCLVICSLQSPWLGVIFYPAYADRTD